MVLEEAGGKAAPQPAATHQRPADSWGKKSCHNQKSPRCNLVIMANVMSTDRCGDRHAEEGERETERERETGTRANGRTRRPSRKDLSRGAAAPRARAPCFLSASCRGMNFDARITSARLHGCRCFSPRGARHPGGRRELGCNITAQLRGLTLICPRALLVSIGSLRTNVGKACMCVCVRVCLRVFFLFSVFFCLAGCRRGSGPV